MGFKETLLMPKTDFPMRGNLGKREPEFQNGWNDMDLYNALMKKNEDKPLYVLHDGPPYANGNIHMGHALNKILKDFIIRYKNMNGYLAPYTPGWDTHGLPIENALTKVEKVDRKSMPTHEFRTLCMEYAKRQIASQMDDFKRLGVIGDWENYYATYQYEFEKHQLKVFAKMVEKGLVFKGLKPVYWSPSSESALAEAEIEYHDHKSPSIFVAMPVVDGKDLIKDAEFLIWTTTPWTIPANLANSVGSKIEYALISADGRRLVVAKELIDKLTETIGWENVEILETYLGEELEYMTYKHPLYDRVSPIICGDHVSVEDGSGIVHTAPGHGQDDFIIGKQYGLDIYCPVDGQGILDDSTGFGGMFVEDANKAIVQKLDELGALLQMKWIKHSYPHDWRTNKPIIFRATEQWFASIEKIKSELLTAVDDTRWLPEWGQLRMTNMIKDREEWCISRQRVWGVPIPAFYAEDGTAILDAKIIEHVSELFGEFGSNVWFEREAKDLLPEGYTHPGSPNGIFKKETDIMDVWFDSGTSHQGGLLPFGYADEQVDLYLEGSDQYRGWFNSSLSTYVSIKGKAPYKMVLSHGFINDGDGKKMSKSLGNGIDPIKVSNQQGADILRLWVASVDYQSDVRISNEMMKQVAEGYRKIRNTFRFMLGNLSDFSRNYSVDFSQLAEVDQYVLIKLNELNKEALEAYDNFAFDDVFRKVINFITFFSGFYMDFTKDILYIEKQDSLRRRQVQTVFFETFDTVVRLLTPILPHTTDEAYSFINEREAANTQMLSMKEVKVLNDIVSSKWDKFMSLRDDILKALEEARNSKVIGKSFESKLTLYPNAETKELLDSLHANIAQILIVSKLEIADGEGEFKFENCSIDVAKADGHTCERCWQVVDEVNDEGICSRCEEVITD